MPQLMLSRLWPPIKNADFANPFFQRAYQSDRRKRPRRVFRIVLWTALLLLGLAAIPLVFPLAVLILLGTNIIGGANIAVAVSSAVVYEKESALFDLLAVTPGGARDVSWQMALGAAHRTRAYREMRVWRWLIPLTVALFPLIIGVLVAAPSLFFNYAFGPSDWADHWLTTVLVTIGAVLGAVALRLDGFYAVPSAVLIGLLSAARFDDRLTAQTVAGAGFVGLQLVVYIAVVVGVALAYVLIMAGVGLVVWLVSSWDGNARPVLSAVVSYVFILFSVGILLAVREASLRGLWWLYNRFGTSAD